MGSSWLTPLHGTLGEPRILFSGRTSSFRVFREWCWILAAASTIVSTFLLVFVAEWGDKSFFSTIALAAASSPLGVIGGALAGHGFATLLAVLGGSLLGNLLSEKEKGILEHLEVLLSSQIHCLCKLSPILAAMSIPSW